MIESIWGESGENLDFGIVSNWLKLLRSLVIPPRLERGTYCLEGLFRLFLIDRATSKKSNIWAFSLWKSEFPNSSCYQLSTVKMHPTWGVFGKHPLTLYAFQNLKMRRVGKSLQIISSPHSYTNLNPSIKTTSRQAPGGDYGRTKL